MAIRLKPPSTELNSRLFGCHPGTIDPWKTRIDVEFHTGSAAKHFKSIVRPRLQRLKQLYEAHGCPMVVATTLRAPEDLMFSAHSYFFSPPPRSYMYWKNHTEVDNSLKLQAHFQGWLTVHSDLLTGFFAASSCSSHINTVCHLVPDKSKNSTLCENLEPRCSLKSAIARLADFDHLGFTDNLSSSIWQIAAAVGVFFTVAPNAPLMVDGSAACNVHSTNVTAQPLQAQRILPRVFAAELSQTVSSMLHRNTCCDSILYAYALNKSMNQTTHTLPAWVNDALLKIEAPRAAAITTSTMRANQANLTSQLASPSWFNFTLTCN